MKKLYNIVLKGNEGVWVLNTMQNPNDFPTYQQEGLPIMRYPFTTKWEEFCFRFFPKGKLYAIDMQGETSHWSFLTYVTPEAIEDMKKDGVDLLYEVANVIPEWVAKYGLVRPWCFFQDLINFRWKELFLNKEELL